MASDTHIAMHHEHRAWQDEASQWRDDLRIWQQEIVAAQGDLRDVEKALNDHFDHMRRHASTVRLHEMDTDSGQRLEEKESKDKTFYRLERRSGSFSRTVTMPCNINEDEVVAEYVNGVLSLTLPKAESAKAKKISVKG